MQTLPPMPDAPHAQMTDSPSQEITAKPRSLSPWIVVIVGVVLIALGAAAMLPRMASVSGERDRLRTQLSAQEAATSKLQGELDQEQASLTGANGRLTTAGSDIATCQSALQGLSKSTLTFIKGVKAEKRAGLLFSLVAASYYRTASAQFDHAVPDMQRCREAASPTAGA